jgi:hypothetical protein
MAGRRESRPANIAPMAETAPLRSRPAVTRAGAQQQVSRTVLGRPRPSP